MRNKSQSINCADLLTVSDYGLQFGLISDHVGPIERFFIDFLRFHPVSEYIGAITVTQIVYLVMFGIAFFLMKRARFRV